MNAIARLVKWSYHEGDLKKGAPYPPCTGMHRRAVCVYGAGDLKWIVQQHHLLANKFDPKVDDQRRSVISERRLAHLPVIQRSHRFDHNLKMK